MHDELKLEACPEKPLEWRCFHCGDVFTSERCARLHFGRDGGATPACIIKGADGGLLQALRDAEEQADEAIQAIHAESTDAAKAYHRQRCRHTQALIAAEESGYEKGLADGRTLPPANTEADVERAARAIGEGRRQRCGGYPWEGDPNLDPWLTYEDQTAARAAISALSLTRTAGGEEAREVAISAAVGALPLRWRRGEAQKSFERQDVAPLVDAVLSSLPVRSGEVDEVSIRRASDAAYREMRAQGFSGGWDHDALVRAIVAALATPQQVKEGGRG